MRALTTSSQNIISGCDKSESHAIPFSDMEILISTTFIFSGFLFATIDSFDSTILSPDQQNPKFIYTSSDLLIRQNRQTMPKFRYYHLGIRMKALYLVPHLQ